MPCILTESSTKFLRWFQEKEYLLQDMHYFGSQEPLILLLFKAEAVMLREEQQPDGSRQNNDWKSTALTDTGVLSGIYTQETCIICLLVKNNKNKEPLNLEHG